jgi:hypothetical protein
VYVCMYVYLPRCCSRNAALWVLCVCVRERVCVCECVCVYACLYVCVFVYVNIPAKMSFVIFRQGDVGRRACERVFEVFSCMFVCVCVCVCMCVCARA